ncbi:MAG: aldehyde ferredoxin oxidoreductase C-terminal domain-containing protein, partial [bacterium]
VRGAFDDLYDESATLLNAVTGTDADGAEIETIARRIVDLRKAFNIREGWQPEDDTLPGRFLTEPIPSGPAKGVSLPRERLDFMIRSYNLGRGCPKKHSVV